jgi:hypothetical protein
MCPEFFLVLFYFSILSFVNFFLVNLLKSYLKKIFLFYKYKTIFKYSTKENLCLFFLLQNKKKQFQQLLPFIKLIEFPSEDTFILGSFYQFISNSLKNEKENLYFFQLIKNQLFFTYSIKKEE